MDRPLHQDAAAVAAEPAPDAIEALMLRHRRRFVSPLLDRGDWIDADTGTGDERDAATVVALTTPTAAERIPALPRLCAKLAAGGILVIAVSGDADTLHHALAARFARVACWRQRPIGGSILVRAQFAAARVAPLADRAAAGGDGCTILACSDGPLPPLAEGIYEADGSIVALHASGPPEVDAPQSPARPELEDRAILRARAASLVDRLAAVDAQRRAAEGSLRPAQLHHVAAGPWRDPPAGRVPWPLHEGVPPELVAADPYNRRTEDDLVAVAVEGAAFLRRFGFDGGTPDFAGAVAALNALRSGPCDAPDASIVIPVHGQLAYTLNCLHALFLLADRTPAEVVVVDDASPDETERHLGVVRGIRLIGLPANRGFIDACNTGAAAARGALIVILNNDTRVLPGWLDRLADSFRLFPRAGIVGSKLLYPDGTLQEAGGILWRGGAAWNYGRGDDPNRPQYCFSRQVDYVSGASIAVPGPVWERLGGLDPRFAPAYYEDCDLFLRARAAGFETWLQSGSRLIHYEGKTGGTDVAAGTKAYQVVNGRKFRARHRAALLEHYPLGEVPVLARDRVRRGRALVVEATVPTPREDAGSAYALTVMRLLVELNYSVTFVPQDNFLYRPGHTELLMHMGIECVHAPYDVDFDAFIEREGARFDVAVVFRASIFERVRAALRQSAPQAALLLDVSDLEYLRLERAAALSGDARAAAEAGRVKAREVAAMAHADCILSPSPFEVGLIAEALPGAAVLALPLMVEVVGTRAPLQARRDVAFLGGYTHPPNVDAVAYFAATMMPALRRDAPGTRFIVAGANPLAEVLALAGADIVVTGQLDDLAPMFDAVRVFVCPLRYGAGMKGKILTAMAHGVPVVTTSIGIEGIAAEDGADVLVADSPDAIVAACVRLLRDDALWQALSDAGLRLVQALYGRDTGRVTLEGAIDLALQRWTHAAALPTTGGEAEPVE